MNPGGFLTRKCLLEPVVQACRELGGAAVFAEYPVRLGHSRGYMDLRVDFGPCPIAIEAEIGPKRLGNDLRKAMALPAHLLLVVVPNWQSCGTARKTMARILEQRRITGLLADAEPAILILPVGPAIQQLRQINDFVTRSLSDLSHNPKIIRARLKQAHPGPTNERSKL